MHEPTERFEAQTALADMLVSIHSGRARPLRIISMEHLQPLQANEPFKPIERRSISGFRDNVVSRRDQMTGVEAHAHPRRVVEPLDDCSQMLESIADRPTLSGRVFKQHHRPTSSLPCEYGANG